MLLGLRRLRRLGGEVLILEVGWIVLMVRWLMVVRVLRVVVRGRVGRREEL
jgi:hypothetical protein